MSGGAFDYVFFKFENGEAVNYEVMNQLSGMIEYMDDFNIDIANELRDIYNKMKALSDSLKNDNLVNLIKDIEWAASGDTSGEKVIKTWEKYKNERGG